MKWVMNIILWIVLIAFILSTVFFSWILAQISQMAISANHEFFAYLPWQIRLLFSLIVLFLWIQVYKKFKE